TIEYRPTSPLVYMLDGGFPDLPRAKRVRHYTEPGLCPGHLEPESHPSARRNKQDVVSTSRYRLTQPMCLPGRGCRATGHSLMPHTIPLSRSASRQRVLDLRNGHTLA